MVADSTKCFLEHACSLVMSKLHSVEKIGLVRHDKIGCTSEEYFKSLCPWDCKAGLEV